MTGILQGQMVCRVERVTAGSQDGFEFTAGEVHCYFPEWADRPVSTEAASESDHNSYMAGGYAEEFGYRSGTDSPAALEILDGDPERCRLWSVQMGGLHPGYPECARPLDRIRVGWDVPPVLTWQSSRAREDCWAKAEVHFTAVRVRKDRPAAAGSWWRALRILRLGMAGEI